MTAASHDAMHAEHRHWEIETDFWRDEVATWEHELTKAIADLANLETALKKQEEKIRTHAAAIRLADLDVSAHEHALVEFEKGGQGVDLIPLAAKHKTEATRHSDLRQTHERIKRRHHELMSLWQTLLRAVASAG